MKERRLIQKVTTLSLCATVLLSTPAQATAVSTIFGTDDRVIISDAQSAPYHAVCRLVIHWPDGSVHYSTGFVYGERLIATAAHGLYHPERGGAAEKIELYFGASEQAAPYAQMSATSENSRLHTPAQWQRTQNWKYDYGVIELSSPPDMQIFPLKLVDYSADKLRGMDATLLGYDYLSQNLYQSSGKIAQARPYDLLYRIDTLHGESGGPILDQHGNVIGIANYGAEEGGLTYNSAARMSGEVYQFFQQILKQSTQS